MSAMLYKSSTSRYRSPLVVAAAAPKGTAALSRQGTGTMPRIRITTRDATGATVNDTTLEPHDVPTLVAAKVLEEHVSSLVELHHDGHTVTYTEAPDT